MVTRRGLALLAVCGILLIAGCSSVDRDDPNAVATATLNAVAEADCKTVHELFPGVEELAAEFGETYPESECSNTITGGQAVGEYTCQTVENNENTESRQWLECVSPEDAETPWSVATELSEDGWIVTSLG